MSSAVHNEAWNASSSHGKSPDDSTSSNDGGEGRSSRRHDSKKSRARKHRRRDDPRREEHRRKRSKKRKHRDSDSSRISSDDERRSKRKHKSERRKKLHGRERKVDAAIDTQKSCNMVQDPTVNITNSNGQEDTTPHSQIASSCPSSVRDDPINEVDLKPRRQMAPMSREEYERQQSQVRHVLDEETGRMRLVRGTGEIIETMVSRAQHAAINQQATRNDGSSFARHVFHAAAGKR